MHNANTCLLIAVLLTLQAKTLSLVFAAEDLASPPNIVFLFADDQNTYSVGCYGKQIRCDRLTGNIDFAPTILELAGQPIPTNMDGKSLLGLLQDPDKGGHDQMSFINVYGPLPVRSLNCLTRRYKYTYWWYGDDQMKPAEELFDTQNDPLELTNLASHSDNGLALEAMRKKYDQELAKWKQQAVEYNDYQRFGRLFDRHIPLSEKSVRRPKRARPRRLAEPSKTQAGER